MDPRSQTRFDAILQKEITGLSESDMTFLKARRDYLTEGQLSEYEDLFYPEVEEDKVPDEAPKDATEKAPLYVAKKDRKKGK